MKYLSVCSGIEAATVAWHPLGWEPVAFGEIEKFPSQVLAHHYPDTPNWGDMTKFKEWPDADVNVFVGGTPCQSFSVAGLRKGLDDPRGNLMLTYLAIAARYRPQWLVWENVPGVLSSNGGHDFASLLRGMGECGYGFAYRILDAQYFGVAQRRRRVFVVGYLGNWRPAAAVLFERHSLSGHLAPSREKREETPSPTGTSLDVSCIGTLTAGFGKVGAPEVDAYTCIPAIKTLVGLQDCNNFSSEITGTIVTREGCAADTAHMVMQPIALAENTIGRKPENGGNGDGFTEEGPMYTLNATGVHGVAQPVGAFKPGQSASAHSIGYESEMAPTLEAGEGGNNKPAVHVGMAVRRLTPKECERLQGFPDNYTDIQHKGKATPDGPRYKALGNSMAVPVMAWIGKRIQEVDAICQTQKQ